MNLLLVELENRGDMTFSECDQFLFHQMNKGSGIFMGGKATIENTTFGVHEWNKKQSFTEKVKFSISFLLKNCNN